MARRRLQKLQWTLGLLFVVWYSLLLWQQQQQQQQTGYNTPVTALSTPDGVVLDWKLSYAAQAPVAGTIEDNNDSNNGLPLHPAALVQTTSATTLPRKSTNSSTVSVSTTRNLNNSTVCSVPPGQGRAEGGLLGYQVFLRMTSAQESSPAAEGESFSLLCIWEEGKDSSSSSSTTGTTKDCFSLSYGDCQGVLKVHFTNETKSTIKTQRAPANGKIHSIRVPLSTEGLQQVFQYIDSQTDYDWFHWTDPTLYYLVPKHLHRFLATQLDAPALVQPWIMKHSAEQHSPYHQLFGEKPKDDSCVGSRTGNRHVARLLSRSPHCATLGRLPLEQEQEQSNKFSLTALQGWIAACMGIPSVTCIRPPPDRHTKWLFLKRYFELELPPADGDQWHQHHLRMQALMHGTCNAVWDRPMGALDAQGNAGYVHNVTFLRHSPAPFTYHVAGEEKALCDLPFGQGDEGIYGYQGLQKIRIATAAPPASAKRVLCMVYTHTGRHFRVRSIAETWGPRCDGFFAASNQTDPSIGAVNLLHEGPEIYDNMWLKVRAMFQYAYDHYRNDFDYFHIGGDDHYVIPENLRWTVSVGSWKGPWDESQPLFLGGSLALNEKRRYCNGGSGYTLNRIALELLVEQLFPKPQCMPHWQASYEDRLVAACFRSVGIQCMDTNDQRNETRYHTWNADQHAAWKIGKPAQDWKKLRDFHGIAWKEGLGQISESSVSFHLKRTDARMIDSGMRRYHAILYGLCNETSVT